MAFLDRISDQKRRCRSIIVSHCVDHKLIWGVWWTRDSHFKILCLDVWRRLLSIVALYRTLSMSHHIDRGDCRSHDGVSLCWCGDLGVWDELTRTPGEANSFWENWPRHVLAIDTDRVGMNDIRDSSRVVFLNILNFLWAVSENLAHRGQDGNSKLPCEDLTCLCEGLHHKLI